MVMVKNDCESAACVIDSDPLKTDFVSTSKLFKLLIHPLKNIKIFQTSKLTGCLR